MTARQICKVGQTFLPAQNRPASDGQAPSSALPLASAPLTTICRRIPHRQQDGSIYWITFVLPTLFLKINSELGDRSRISGYDCIPTRGARRIGMNTINELAIGWKLGSTPVWDAESWLGGMYGKPSRDACCGSTTTDCCCTLPSSCLHKFTFCWNISRATISRSFCRASRRQRPGGERAAGDCRNLLARRVLRSHSPQRKAVSTLCSLYC